MLSSDRPLVDLMVSVVSIKLVFGDLIAVIINHIGTRSPLLVYIGFLIVDVVTRRILCEAGVSILPVTLTRRISFLL